MSRDVIVSTARGWIGTPFRHQGRMKRTSTCTGGVDCLGLVLGVFKEVGGVIPAELRSEILQGYGHYPDPAYLQQQLKRFLSPSDKLMPGYITLIEVDGAARHLAIVSDGGGLGLIHAYAPMRAVVEHRLSKEWHHRIQAIYSLKNNQFAL